MVSVDNARIEAWFVDSRDKSNLPKDPVGMFFPKSGGLRVSLHCRQYRYNRSLRDRLTLFVVDPPVAEGPVRSYIETLFWWGCFCKCI